MATTLEPPAATHTRRDGELQPKPDTGRAAREPERQPGERLPSSADPDFHPPGPDSRITVTTRLLPRHHAWLAGAAEREGRSIEAFLEGLIRRACANDPLTVRDTRPQEPGQPVGSGRRA
jgi:hypothetical protein